MHGFLTVLAMEFLWGLAVGLILSGEKFLPWRQ